MRIFHRNDFPARKTKRSELRTAIFFFPTTKYNLFALYLITATATVPCAVFTKVLDKKRRKRVESDDLHWGRAKLASERAAI